MAFHVLLTSLNQLHVRRPESQMKMSKTQRDRVIGFWTYISCNNEEAFSRQFANYQLLWSSPSGLHFYTKCASGLPCMAEKSVHVPPFHQACKGAKDIRS